MFGLSGYSSMFGNFRHNRLRFKYRYDPVPFTGIDSHGRLFRSIRTTQERRYNSSEEHKPYVRGKRRHLPEYWDDIPIESQRDICWKRHRNRQYKS